MDFAFTKKNYILLFVGLAFMASGLILMIGGGSDDPTKFSDEIFNFQRLTLAPILIAIGFIIEFFAIMSKNKEDDVIMHKNKEDNIIMHKDKEDSVETIKREGFEGLANRKFQHKNFVGTKVTWKFNEDGSKVRIKGGWLGINTVNASVAVESLGEGRFQGKGFLNTKYSFTLEGNRIKSGPVFLNEIQ